MSRPPARVRLRFWLESALGALTGSVFLLTVLWPEWIEAFGWDPDQGNGSLEWAVVAGLLALCVVTTMTARAEWRRSAAGSRA